ncbi:hypothetical protein ACMU_12250 [Actibacterium mucosum KCTC 23349]|uniref:IclR family transcriptional regulator n=1 Tax=Actibacterium mucosum KCTC 23349 TaxID=1454373 RepID=A0A037ZIV6_9RHOB|nr:IclR family transcriptional regulator [Actibacterium mucosum]KAJ55462.1 hypothetical protein ACMU_12250 [Actibacterium mucosum KCTC 23349]
MSVKIATTALKAFNVLEYVAESEADVSASDVAGGTGFDRATCYRLLMTLNEAGYVQLDPANRRFSLSYKVVSLARHILQEDREIETVRDVMRQIARETTEGCHYSVLDGDYSVITLRERGKQVVTVDFAVGERAELYTTAGGKAMLAFQDIREIQRYLAGTMKSKTAHTIVEPQTLRQELISIRSHGVAYDNEELMAGLRCVAAPVFEADGTVRSTIALSGPVSRYTDTRIAELEKVLRAGARELTRRRGGPEWSV